MTEYLYDRENPKSHFRQRISGIQGLFFGVPNINERADMIGRYASIFMVNQFSTYTIELLLRKQTVISTSSYRALESQEIWPRSGEHSKTSLDSLRIPSDTCSGKSIHFTLKTESDSSGYSSHGISTNLSFSIWPLNTVSLRLLFMLLFREGKDDWALEIQNRWN